MLNIRELEELRTKEELINYFKAKGKNITEEEIAALKRSYERTQENNAALSLEQLDDVAGGLVHLFYNVSENKVGKKYFFMDDLEKKVKGINEDQNFHGKVFAFISTHTNYGKEITRINVFINDEKTDTCVKGFSDQFHGDVYREDLGLLIDTYPNRYSFNIEELTRGVKPVKDVCKEFIPSFKGIIPAFKDIVKDKPNFYDLFPGSTEYIKFLETYKEPSPETPLLSDPTATGSTPVPWGNREHTITNKQIAWLLAGTVLFSLATGVVGYGISCAINKNKFF